MRSRFSQITYIKFDFLSLLTPPDCKVKPEQIAPSIGIYPQKEIVFALAHPDHTVQISPFKPRLENQLLL